MHTSHGIIISCFMLLLIQHRFLTNNNTFEPDHTSAQSKTPSEFEFTDDFSEDDTENYICCYRDPNHRENNVGRPFYVDHNSIEAYHGYMRTSGITHEEKLDHPLPQPVTAFSSNHYKEHAKQIGTAMRVFGDIPIVVYDLGMSDEQINYVKNNKSLIYKQLDFSKYPEHVLTLTTYAWKTLIWAEMLQEYHAITWFDTSVQWSSSTDTFKKVVSNYIVNKKSSILFFVHETGHSTAWATNARMWSYFPSNMTEMSTATGTVLVRAHG